MRMSPVVVSDLMKSSVMVVWSRSVIDTITLVPIGSGIGVEFLGI